MKVESKKADDPERTCHRCGACCFVFKLSGITKEEAEVLGMDSVEKKPLLVLKDGKDPVTGESPDPKKREPERFFLKKTKRDNLPSWALDGACVLYDPVKGCTIHDDKKPKLCQNFWCSATHLMRAVVENICKRNDLDNRQQFQLMQDFLDTRLKLNNYHEKRRQSVKRSRLSQQERIILYRLKRSDVDGMYASDLADNSNGIIKRSGIYTLLRRMVKKQYLSVQAVRPYNRGAVRKKYQSTEYGREVLTFWEAV
jgi:Fe-S-cluster containining protein